MGPERTIDLDMAVGLYQHLDRLAAHLGQDGLLQLVHGEEVGQQRLQLDAAVVDEGDGPVVGVRVVREPTIFSSLL